MKNKRTYLVLLLIALACWAALAVYRANVLPAPAEKAEEAEKASFSADGEPEPLPKAERQDSSGDDPFRETQRVSSGYMIFEIPKSWVEDISHSGGDQYYYVPKDNARNADCFVQVSRGRSEQMNIGVEELFDDPEKVKKGLADAYGDGVENIQILDFGDTNLGRTVLVDLTARKEDTEIYIRQYVAERDGYTYLILAGGREGDRSSFQVAETILDTADFGENSGKN